MRNLLVLFLVVAVASLCALDAGAAEKAATDQLPAALSELGVQSSQVMTVEQAEQVRGEWMYIRLSGTIRAHSFNGQIYAAGYANYFSIYVNPYTFALTAY